MDKHMRRTKSSKKITVTEHAAVDPELESRVDSMMSLSPEESVRDTAREEAASVIAADKPQDRTPPPIDIFNDPKTAPEVPSELAKTMSVADEPVTVNTLQKPALNDEIAPEKNPETATVADALDEAETDKAIDEITRAEADDILKIQDEVVANAPVLKPRSRWVRFWQSVGALWAFGWVRFLVTLLLLAAIAAVVAWPTSRYFVLNTAGVRVGASMTVVDSVTGLALKNAVVRIGEAQQTTDSDGSVTFSELRLGEQELLIERVAYAPLKRTLVLGWGSNPLGAIEVQSTGVKYAFTVTDFVSGKPIGNAEASHDDATAVTNKDGEISLAVNDVVGEVLTVTINAPNYRSETIEVPVAQDEPTVIRLVAAAPVAYLTNGNNSLDLYRVDIDGKNKKLLLANVGGTDGRDVQLLVDEAGRRVALVSKRNSERTNAAGTVLDAVTVVDVADGKLTELDYAEQARLLLWSGNRIVYTATYQTPADQAASEERLVSHDLEANARLPLASAASFRGLLSARGYLYYAYENADESGGLARIKPDGSNKKTLVNEAAWSLVRRDADVIGFQTAEGRRILTLSSLAITETTTAASDVVHVDGSGDRSLWIDDRDGTEELLVHTYESGQDSVIARLAGMTVPLRWLNDRTALVTVASDTETALYAVHLDGGKPVKVVSAVQTSLDPAAQ